MPAETHYPACGYRPVSAGETPPEVAAEANSQVHPNRSQHIERAPQPVSPLLGERREQARRQRISRLEVLRRDSLTLERTWRSAAAPQPYEPLARRIPRQVHSGLIAVPERDTVRRPRIEASEDRAVLRHEPDTRRVEPLDPHAGQHRIQLGPKRHVHLWTAAKR